MLMLQVIVPRCKDGVMRYEVENLSVSLPVDREVLLQWLEEKRRRAS